MNNAEKFRNFINKLQNLPEQKKKIVLWTIVGVLAAIMGFFWARSAYDRFSGISDNINIFNINK